MSRGAEKPAITAAQLAAAYDFPETTGAGQHIAILELAGGFRTTDLLANGISQSALDEHLTVLGPNEPASDEDMAAFLADFPSQLHVPAGADSLQLEWTFETNLDLQLVMLLAPGADVTISFVGAEVLAQVDNGCNGPAVVQSLAELIALDKPPSIISLSFDLGPESTVDETWGANTVRDFETQLEAARDRGITVCVASGDWGSRGRSGGHQLCVTYPPCSGLVLACGGTDQRLDDEGAIEHQSVWLGDFGGNDVASAGGFSQVSDCQSWQQAAIDDWWTQAKETDGIQELFGGEEPTGRGVPDVAALADYNAGVEIVCCGTRTRSIGTSAAAPIWAALLARIYEGLGQALGLATPRLYAESVRAALADVPSGTNFVGGVNQVFEAVPGRWDPCTGLGTPRGSALLAALKDQL